MVHRPFQIYTDHASLTYLKSQSHVSRRNARWLDLLSEFNFTMHHIAGDQNVADHLSRIQHGEIESVLNAFISVFDKSALM